MLRFFGHDARARAHGDEDVGHVGDATADQAMRLFFGAAQFQHVTEDGDATAVQFGQQVQCRQGGVGARVVGVVDDRGTARAGYSVDAELGCARAAQPGDDFFP